jgi:hypothetical protein
VIFCLDGLALKKRLEERFSGSYRLDATKMELQIVGEVGCCDEGHSSKLEFLCAGENGATLAWLRFGPERVETLHNGLQVLLPMVILLLSKMSACNTRLRAIRPGRAEKGRDNKRDCFLIVKKM